MGVARIKKKSLLVWNIITFNILSMLFYYVSVAIARGFSALSVQNFIFWMRESFFTIGLFFLVIVFLLFWLSKITKYLMFAFIFLISFNIINILTTEYSKTIVFILAFYLPIAFIFLQFLTKELGESYNDKGFSSFELFSPMLKKIPVVLKKGNLQRNGWLINWSEQGCFVFLKEGLKSTEGRYVLNILFRNVEFKFEGYVASSDSKNKAYGFLIEREDAIKSNWDFFISKIEDMGFLPKFLR